MSSSFIVPSYSHRKLDITTTNKDPSKENFPQEANLGSILKFQMLQGCTFLVWCAFPICCGLYPICPRPSFLSGTITDLFADLWCDGRLSAAYCWNAWSKRTNHRTLTDSDQFMLQCTQLRVYTFPEILIRVWVLFALANECLRYNIMACNGPPISSKLLRSVHPDRCATVSLPEQVRSVTKCHAAKLPIFLAKTEPSWMALGPTHMKID